jgi:methyl-accepting chemotaxis protein
VAAEYVDRISKGDIPEKIRAEYKGDFNEIKNNLNQCIDAVNGLVAEAAMLTEAAVEGKLDTRGDVERFSGDYAKIVQGLNDTIGTLVGHIDQIPAPVMIIDKDFTVRYMNKAGAGAIGATQAQLIGKKCFDQFKTSDCNTARCACTKAMASGNLETSETDAHPGGNDLFISYDAVPIRNESGDIIGALEIVTDQTAVKKAMEDAGAKVKLLNNIPTPIMAVDKEFNVEFMNPAGARAVAKTPEECIGLKCFNLFNTAHCNTSDCQVGKAMREDAVCTNDTVAKLPSGELPIRYTGAPLKDENGAIMGGLEYVLDISKEMEITHGVLELAEAAVEGRLDNRADVDKFEGNYRRIVQGVNDTLDAVIGPLNVAAEYVDRISKGDIPEKISDEYKGDFNEIKNNLNQCIDALKGLIDEDGGVALQAAANKDLTLRLQREYHGAYATMKENINQVLENMSEALGHAGMAAEQVGSASGQVASSSQQLAEGAQEQAAALEETSSSLEQMSAMVKQNAENANQANNLMGETGQVVDRAKGSMGDLTKSMEEISEASEETQKIIKTIDEIAFQTNLLALNAAVEAARAGEAGAGFAVVADEVRNLAMRAAEAAKNTADLIEGTVKRVKAGSDLVEKTNTEFNEVAESSGKVGDLVSEIAAASSEQAQGIEQVNKAVAEMDKLTQQNAANSEESASASEEMSAQAQELNSMLAAFKLNGQAVNAPRKETTPKRTPNPKPVEHTQQRGKDKDPPAKPDAVIPFEEGDAADADFKDF